MRFVSNGNTLRKATRRGGFFYDTIKNVKMANGNPVISN